MRKALMCDNCGETLALDARGESENGEDAAWITLGMAEQRYDLCTRSCVAEFIERPEVIAAHNQYAESITGIARAIREERESDD